jgi:hypothetical protein
MGKGGGVSQNLQNAEAGTAQQLTATAQQEQQQSGQEFATSFPGFQTAENYYQQLSTGDPGAISRAISPATQQINAQTTANAQRIEQDSPRGGAKNLALEENQINKGAQIGNLATQSYLGSFQNLAGLAGQGVGESIQSAGTGISGLNAAGNQYSNIANQQAEGKASQLGFISSLAGSGAELAGLCWIAEALWGEGDARTLVVRYYLINVLEFHWLGKYFCRLYRRHGERIAGLIPKWQLLRMAMEVVFGLIYMRASAVIPESEQRAIIQCFWDSRHPRVNDAG